MCDHFTKYAAHFLPAWTLLPLPRVPQTVGNQTGSGLVRYETGPNSKFKFKFKKRKIPKNTLRCDKSNGVKFSQKFIYLV